MPRLKPPAKIPVMPRDEFLSPQQLLRFLKRTDRTLRYWEARGIAPPVIRQGTLRLYRRESVLRWLEEREGKKWKGRPYLGGQFHFYRDIRCEKSITQVAGSTQAQLWRSGRIEDGEPLEAERSHE